MQDHTDRTRDRDIRILLRVHLAGLYGGDARTVVVDEMGILWGDRRVDVGVINGELHGYEIKSDADDLSRLLAQATAYAQVFDRLTLVVGDRHLGPAVMLLPAWWGIQTVGNDPSGGRMLVEVRQARVSPHRDPHAIAQLLWRDEAAAILENCGRRVSRARRRAELHAEIACEIPFDDLRAQVRAALKSRSNWRAASLPS